MNLKNRIKKNFEFKEVIENKKVLKLKSCNIFFKENPESYRFGISVGKKIGNAVTRNLTKRHIRAILKDINDTAFIKNFDFIIIAKTNINSMTFEELSNEITTALMSQFLGERI